MTKQSEKLTQFYQAYAQWLDDGAPQDAPFTRTCGLCYNLRKSSKSLKLLKEMWEQFTSAGLHEDWPFHNSFIEYDQEGNADKCHLNPKRNAWVREHANG